MIFCTKYHYFQVLGEPGTGGSSTPSMVGSVKKWQKSDPHKSHEIWQKLSEANSVLEMQLKLLSRLAKEQWDVYTFVINHCSMVRSDKVFPEDIYNCINEVIWESKI